MKDRGGWQRGKGRAHRCAEDARGLMHVSSFGVRQEISKGTFAPVCLLNLCQIGHFLSCCFALSFLKQSAESLLEGKTKHSTNGLSAQSITFALVMQLRQNQTLNCGTVHNAE